MQSRERRAVNLGRVTTKVLLADCCKISHSVLWDHAASISSGPQFEGQFTREQSAAQLGFASSATSVTHDVYAHTG